MKDKILAALKTKYAEKRLSDKALSTIADMLVPTVTDEAGIDAAVAGVEPLVSQFQSEIGVAVTNALKDKKNPKADEPKPEEPPTPTPAPPTGEVVPSYIKTMMETMQTMASEIIGIKAGKTVETRKSKLEEAVKDTTQKFQDITLKSFGRMTFKDDAEFDEYLATVTTDAKDFVQETVNEKLGGSHRPGVPNAAAGKVSDQDLKEFDTLTKKK